jgi:hypothetical protein
LRGQFVDLFGVFVVEACGDVRYAQKAFVSQKIYGVSDLLV